MNKRNGLGNVDSMLYGPVPLDISEVPVDLRPRTIEESRAGVPGLPGSGTPGPNLYQLVRDVHSIAGTLVLRRGLLGRVVQVGNSPTLIIQASEERGYLILNPAGVSGLTTTGTLFSVGTTLAAPGTTDSIVVACANYKTARFFLNVTAHAGGAVDFDLMTLDPVSGAYILAQTVFSVTGVGTDYANVQTLGIDTDFRIRVTVPAGTSITFSLGYVLKDGLDGTSTGASQTVYIGGAGVSSVAGYPILAGKEKAFYLTENVQLYAVSDGPTLNINIFEL